MRWLLALPAAALCALLVGCVEPYPGTRIQANLRLGSDLSHEFLILPTPGLRPGEPGYYSHYELHAEILGRGSVRLASFLIQPVVRVTNPCIQFLPDPFCVPTAEHPCEPFVNLDRYRLLQLIYGVVSPATTRPTADASNTYGYAHFPGYDFTAWPDPLFEDPYETSAASKLARDNLIQERVEEFCEYCLPEGHYVGNPRQLTQPSSGELHGVVDGPDPRSGAAVGGIILMVPGQMDRATAIYIYREPDTSRLSAENRWRTDLPPSPGAQILLVGRADGTMGSLQDGVVRGVRTADLVNPYALPLRMHLMIYAGIDEDPMGI